MRLFAVVLCCIALTGCALCPPTPHQPEVLRTVEVAVPVVVPPPQIEIPSRPLLEIETIGNDTSSGRITNAYIITIKQLQMYAEQLEMVIRDLNNSMRDIK